jgi:hypothetical protein
VDLFLAEREVTTSLSERSWLEEYQVCKIAYLGAFSLRLGIVIGIGGSEFREIRIYGRDDYKTSRWMAISSNCSARSLKMRRHSAS